MIGASFDSSQCHVYCYIVTSLLVIILANTTTSVVVSVVSVVVSVVVIMYSNHITCRSDLRISTSG